MKKIPLSGKYGKGKFMLVDDDDYGVLMKLNKSFYVSKSGYVRFSSKDKRIFVHRFLMNAPKGKCVDHVNHNKLDNQKSNLRVCTQRENVMNSRPSKVSSSKFKGVSMNKASGKWFSRIMIKGKDKYLGSFTCEIEAAKAYNKAARKHFGEFAYLNDV